MKERNLMTTAIESKKLSNGYIRGLIALIGGIALFSTVEIDAKIINSQATIPPAIMVFLRFVFTGIALLAISLPRYLKTHGKFTKHDWKIFFLNGAIGISLCLGLFHAAIAMFSNASSAAVVFSANAVFTIIFAKYMNNEAWNIRKWLALVCGLVGISLFIFESGKPDWDTFFAICTMALSAVAFAYSVCLAKREIKNYGATLFMGMSSICSCLVILPFAIYVVLAMPTNIITELKNSFWGMLYMIFAGTTLGYFLYYTGIKHVTAFVASMAFFIKPVLACFFAWFFIDESMNAWTISGTAIIMLALILTLKKKPIRKPLSVISSAE